MKNLAWCALIVTCVIVVGCSAPPTEDEGAVMETETSSAGTAGDDGVMEEGFESGETGSLESSESVSDSESGDGH